MPATTDARLEYLFNRYFEKTCTQEEKDELLRLINLSKYDDQLKYLMDQVWTRLSPAYRLSDRQSERILSGIFPSGYQMLPAARTVRRRVIWWSAAAACLLLLAGAWVLYSHHAKERSAEIPLMPVAAVPSKDDVAPGGNKAILILANGSKLVLDSTHNGVVAKQGNLQVLKRNGQLSYRYEEAGQTAVVSYNTLITPRGGQYQVILPDGSKVWLNAASSLRFPVSFTGGEREVEITGEAYFEVVENKDMPFVVKSGNMEVQVLGTHFDVNAYEDESAVKVTLLQGSVRVAQHITRHSQLLLPGEQAQLNNAGQIAVIKNVDLDETVAWKNGLFLFNDADIHIVMRQIARWYDTEVSYTGDINARLNGMISRNTNLSQVLHMLELTEEVHFKIEGKKIVVLPPLHHY